MSAGHRLAWCVCALLAAANVYAAAPARQEARPELQKAVEKAGSSTVLVESVLPSPVQNAADLPVYNTGFFVGSDGQVLTSIFAVSGGAPVRVRRSDGSVADARVRALDQRCGIAMLETTFKNTTPFERADDPPQVGEWLVAAHAARGPEGTITVGLRPGLLSAPKASLRLFGIQWDGLLVCDMEARPGCATGPVLDVEGRLAGVILGARDDPDGCGCCYVLPARELEPIVTDLLAHKSRRLGWLGVSVARADKAKGLTVGAVLGGSPGFVAGIRPGDVLVELDGTALSEPGVFESKVVQAAPGTELSLRFVRNNETEATRVKVGARPLLISRVPASMSADLSGSQNQFLRLLDTRTQAAQQRLIEELTTQNRELRERIEHLEGQLQEGEGQGKQDAHE